MRSPRFDATVLTLGFAFLYIPIIIMLVVPIMIFQNQQKKVV